MVFATYQQKTITFSIAAIAALPSRMDLYCQL